MRELQQLLKRFLARELSLDDMQIEFAELLRKDPALPGPAAAWLDAGERDGLLSAALSTALKNVVFSHLAATGAGPSPGESGIFGVLDMDGDEPADSESHQDERQSENSSETFVRDPEATEMGAGPRLASPGAGEQVDAAGAAADDDSILHIGSLIGGRYELLSQLGSGGMGKVFKARDRLRAEAQDRNPHIALKVLSDEFKRHPDSMIALQREVQRAQKLAHPNVITVHEFFRDGPHLYMTMELLEGSALDQLMQSEYSAGLSYEKAWPIIEGICHALQYGHDKGIVHSDIKPGNIFVCNDGTVKVLDLGISRPMKATNVANAEETAFDPGERLGSLTPAYAALEMWYQDTPDPRDDVYALACVAYVLLTGKHPFGGQSAREAKKQGLVPAKIESIARGQWKALLEGLAFDRADRTASVDKFRRQMDPQAVVRRNRRYAGAGIVAVAVVVGLVSMNYYTQAVEDRAMDDRGRMDLPNGAQGDSNMLAERPVLTAEQQSEIDSLLSLAELQFSMVGNESAADELSYVLSLGPNNVVQLADTVLQIDPGYEDAFAAKRRVYDIYVSRARELEDQKVFDQALALTQNAEEVIPNTSTVLRLQRRICDNAPAACATQ